MQEEKHRNAGRNSHSSNTISISNCNLSFLKNFKITLYSEFENLEIQKNTIQKSKFLKN